MPTLSTPARPASRRAPDSGGPRILLRRSSPGETSDPAAPEVAPPPVMPWVAAALCGGFFAAVVGWVVVAGVTVLGWLTGGTGAVSGAIRLGTQLWLLANGAGAEIGGTRWTLIPLGVTAVFAVVIAQVAGFAARQARPARSVVTASPRGGSSQAGRGGAEVVVPDDTDRALARSVVRSVVVMVTTVYVAAVVVVALAIGGPGQAVRGFAVSAALALVAGTYGAARALRVDLTDTWPDWLRAVPRAVAASVCVVGLGGCAAMVVALIQHGDRVSAMTTQLGVTVAGGVVLALLQLSFWPNLLTWAASWTLGAGFTLGDGSIVSPAETDLGLLPSIPVFGALPPEGVGGWPVLGWLGVGVLAGIVGASIVVRNRPAGRFDETTLVGGLAGVVSGVVVVGLAALSRGDLGDGRLVGLGPRLLELGVMAVTLMGLSGMLTGLVWGLLRRPGAPHDVAGDDVAGDDVAGDDVAGDDVAGDETTAQLGDEATTQLDQTTTSPLGDEATTRPDDATASHPDDPAPAGHDPPESEQDVPLRP